MTIYPAYAIMYFMTSPEMQNPNPEIAPVINDEAFLGVVKEALSNPDFVQESLEMMKAENPELLDGASGVMVGLASDEDRQVNTTTLMTAVAYRAMRAQADADEDLKNL